MTNGNLQSIPTKQHYGGMMEGRIWLIVVWLPSETFSANHSSQVQSRIMIMLLNVSPKLPLDPGRHRT